MNCLIFDSDNFDRAKTLASLLSQVGFRVNIRYQTRYYNADGDPDQHVPDEFALVLWHKRNEEEFRAQDFGQAVAVSFSGGGVGEIPDSLSIDAAVHLKRALAESPVGERKAAILAYWNAESFLAFCLLCEARTACGNSASKEILGITIHAPTSLEQWLAPFEGKSREDITKVAGHIGTGEIKAKAESVLNAVDAEGDVIGAIEEFLKIAKRTERQPRA